MDVKKFSDLKSEELYVAFIDILGYKNKIETCDDLKDVAILNFIFENNRKSAEKDLIIFSFSDCMYIVGEKIEKILELIACLQNQLLSASERQIAEYKDINLIRGGITKGNVIADRALNILLGPAVNKAYSLENEIAVYPRIVLDPSAMEKMGDFRQYIKKDIDNVDYFDFLHYLKINKQYSLPKDERNSMTKYLNEYIKCSRNNKINQKYGWFLNYLSRSEC